MAKPCFSGSIRRRHSERSAAGKRFRNLRLCAIALLHNSLNRNRFKDKIVQPFKLLQRPLRLSKRRAAL
ncbi:hypothetical protein E0H51_15620 [Rhizobium leguminosarum bv. viciae]|nr:hypothetical protein E0H51_15620 [Rhizobium leguminosarum bv. viciae]